MSRVSLRSKVASYWSCLWLWSLVASPVIAQEERPLINYGDEVYFTHHGDPNRFVIEPVSSSDWPAMRHGGAADKVTLKLHAAPADQGKPIKGNDIVSIQTTVTTHPGYDRLYESQGGWVYCDKPKGRAQAPEQWWTLERQVGLGELRHGDLVRFRNRYWPDNFISVETNPQWMTAHESFTFFRVELATPPAAKLAMSNQRDDFDTVYDVVYAKGNSQQVLSGTQTWTISQNQEVQLGDERSSNWELGLSLELEVGTDNVRQKTGISASYGQAMSAQRSALKGTSIEKSVSAEYTVPVNAEAFMIMEISIPYVVWDVPGNFESATAESLQLRRLNGSVSQSNMESIVIPNKDEAGQVEPVEFEDVDRALNLLAKKNRKLADQLRKNRLPEWQRKGWVTGGTSVAVNPPPKPSPSPSPKPTPGTRTTLETLAGRYQRMPVENDWQDVTISAVPGQTGLYEWKNKAGIAWNLRAQGNNPELSTDQTNPYFEEATSRTIRVEYRPGGNEIARVWFRDEAYERVGGGVRRPNPAPLANPPFAQIEFDPTGEWDLASNGGRPVKLSIRNGQVIFHDGTVMSLVADRTYGSGSGDQHIRLEFVNEDTVDFKIGNPPRQIARWVRLP